MEKFTKLKAVAAPLDLINIDTDMIIPKQYLKTIKRTGLGKHLFDEMRYDDKGAENPDFILNREPYRQARIIVAGDNFGCGSSREHAPWSLVDFGIRAVIAPSFADIFFANSFNNGLLPIALPQETVAQLIRYVSEAKDPVLEIDLEAQEIRGYGNAPIPFEIDPQRKERLLEGLDEIGVTLKTDARAIETFEKTRETQFPWISGANAA